MVGNLAVSQFQSSYTFTSLPKECAFSRRNRWLALWGTHSRCLHEGTRFSCYSTFTKKGSSQFEPSFWITQYLDTRHRHSSAWANILVKHYLWWLRPSVGMASSEISIETKDYGKFKTLNQTDPSTNVSIAKNSCGNVLVKHFWTVFFS